MRERVPRRAPEPGGLDRNGRCPCSRGEPVPRSRRPTRPSLVAKVLPAPRALCQRWQESVIQSRFAATRRTDCSPRSADIGSGRHSGCSSRRWRREPGSSRSGSFHRRSSSNHSHTPRRAPAGGREELCRSDTAFPTITTASFPRARTPSPTWWPAPGRQVRGSGGPSSGLEDRHHGASLDGAPASAGVGDGPETGQSDHHRERPVPHHPGRPAARRPVPPVIDVDTQAPSTATAARLATAVGAGLSAYVMHLQTATGVPKPDRYDVSQLAPVSVAPARTSQLASVGAFTFVAVFVLWCAAVIALSSLARDLRDTAAASKVWDDLDRSSDKPAAAGGNRLTPQPWTDANVTLARILLKLWKLRLWVAVGVPAWSRGGGGKRRDVPLHRLRECFHPDVGGLAGLRPCECWSRHHWLYRSGQRLRAIDDKRRSASVYRAGGRDPRQSHRRQRTDRNQRFAGCEPCAGGRSKTARTCPARRPTSFRSYRIPTCRLWMCTRRPPQPPRRSRWPTEP